MQSIDFSSNSAGIIKSTPKPFIPSDLLKCPKVWLRVDRIRKSLETLYSGPYDVISRSEHFFTSQLPLGVTTVSMDRLFIFYLSKYNFLENLENSRKFVLVIQGTSCLTICRTPSLRFGHFFIPMIVATKNSRIFQKDGIIFYNTQSLDKYINNFLN